MVKAHSPINWENEPSFNTPINEENLNKMDKTIGVLDDRIIEQETSKLDKSTAYTMVKDISFNENNGVFTVTRLNGSTFTIDTRLEKIAINFKYDYSTQKLIVTLIDGTTQSIDMSALVTQYEFADSATLDFTTDSNGKVTATIKSGSITEDMLQPNYLAEIKVETAKSAQSMANAKISENNAKQSELNAKESEEQALEYSNNAQPLAQSVSGNNPTAVNSTDGNVIYLNNKGYTQQGGEPTPSNPIHINGLADKGYFDGELDIKSVGLLTDAISNKNPFTCKAGDVIKVMYEDVVDNFSMRLIDTGGKAWSYNLSNVNVMEWSAPKDAQEVYFYIKDDAISSVADAKHICVTINGQYAVRVKTQNKNLLKNTGVSTTKSGVTFTVNDDGTTTLNGTATADINFDFKYDVDLTNMQAAFSLSLLSGVVSDKSFMHASMFTSNWYGTCNRYLDDVVISNEKDPYKLKYSIFRIKVKSGMTCTNAKVGMMLREASVTDNNYEPYTEKIVNIPTSAPFYEGDFIEVYADGTGREYRKFKKVVLTSDMTIAKSTTSGAKAVTIIMPDSVKSNYISTTSGGGKAYSNIAVSCNNWTEAMTTEGKFALSSDGYFGFYYDGTVDEFKALLDSTEVYIIYELSTPTSTPLTAEQVAEFMKLQTFKGVTHVTADGDVVMRYYVDNDSGETVAMLHKMILGIS